jgi:putative copper export protein
VTVSVAAGRAARSASAAVRRRPAIAVLAAVGVTAVGALALLRGGVARHPPKGLPDAGLATAWGLPACRFAADAAAVGTAGFLVAALLLLPDPTAEAALRARRAAARWAASWAAASSVELVFTHSDILGVPLPRALGMSLAHTVATFPQEQALAAQIVLAMSAGALAVHSPRVAALPAGCALLLPLATGHSGTASHALAVPALVVHVAAATVWTGGLLALLWAARQAPEDLGPAADRFSGLALGCFLMTAASGTVNAALRLHAPADVFSSVYGQLVLAKSCFLMLLGLFGFRHRRSVLSRIRAGDAGGRAAFRRLAGFELAIMMATFAVAVALARTAPPGS